MLKMFKKYSKKFFIAFSICFVSILTLFATTKTYAYDLDNNGNLVGNNLLTSDTISFGGNRKGTTSTTDVTTTTSWVNGNYNINNIYNFASNDNYSTYLSIDTNNLTLNDTYTIVILVDKQIQRDNLIVYYSYSNSQYDWNATGQITTFSSDQSKVICSRYFTKSNNRYYTIRLTQRNNSNYQYMESNFIILLFKSNYNMNYLINSNQTYYPYSSIEELQQDYNTLLSQYNTLQQQYNTLQTAYSQISNDYQTVVDNYNTLQHQYDSLQSDYSELQNALTHTQLLFNIYVSTHSYTDEEYNSLNNQYQSLQTTYNTLLYQYNNLLVSYNSLQDRYNELLAESTNAMYFALNGATANLYTDVSGTKTLLATDTVSINQSYMNFDNSCIPNINTYLNAYDSSDTTNYPNPYCYIEIELNMSVNSALLFTFDNSILDTDITLLSTISDVTTIYNRNSEFNPYQLVVNSDRLSFNKIVYDGIYMPDYISIDFSLQLDGYSYSLGYEKGVASQQAYINSLNSSVSTMQASINTLRASNQQLQEQVNNTFGWKNLFFAMADTPFKTISNVLGFELFGLNLFTTFIGMITVFAIVWLLKKFI